MTSMPKLPRFRAGHRLLVLILTLAVPLGGCETTGRATKSAPAQAVADPCAPWRPIFLTKAEVATLSDESARQLLAHNLTGQRLCHWQPKPTTKP